MKFVALKDLPQGQVPGEVFEATEAAGNVLVMVGAARKLRRSELDEAKDKPTYQRRDLTAQE